MLCLVRVFADPYHQCGKGLLILPKQRQIAFVHIVFGTFFLCGAPADSDHFTSLTTEQIEQYRKMFYTPEMFWGMDGRIVCLPLEVD